MKRIVFVLAAILLMTVPVSAMEFTAPQAPEAAQEYMPEDTQNFTEGFFQILKKAVLTLRPDVAEAAGVCLSLIAVIVLVSLLRNFPGASAGTVNLVLALAISLLLINPANTFIDIGTSTVTELSEYSKLFFPVMTGAMAAQGGVSASTALYAGTMFFISVLTTLISKLIVPALYIYLCLCVADTAVGEDLLKNIKKFLKWLLTWSLKTVLYLFTGYISITGVISGTADAAAIKATKLTISGAVPVVGSIISDASETILVSASVMKSAAGIYGLLAMLAICLGPFFRIAVQYLMLKLTASVCDVFGVKNASGLVHDFSGAMGLTLAMTGTVCLLLLISTVCFMKGVS